MEADHRPARRPHRAARQGGELLEHGRARPRRTVQRDPHRPRPRVRRGRGLGRGRPLPGVLEPGVHVRRAQRGAQQVRLRHPRAAAQPEHRHRHGPGAGRLPAPGHGQHVRDRRDLPGDREGRRALRAQVRPRPRGRRPVPGGRRPRPQRDDADRRRGHPWQRGARLRAAPAAATRRPLDAPARRRGPHAARAAAGQPRQDGAVLPRRRLGLGADLHDRLRRGGRVPADPAHRHDDLRPGRAGGQGRRPDPAVRRQGVRAARHLRLPDRPDPGDGLRAGPRGRRGGLPPADDRAARPCQGGRALQEGPAQRRQRLPPGRGLPGRPGAVHRLLRGGLRGDGAGHRRRRRRHRPRPTRATRSSWSWTAPRSTPRAAASSPTRA